MCTSTKGEVDGPSVRNMVHAAAIICCQGVMINVCLMVVKGGRMEKLP